MLNVCCGTAQSSKRIMFLLLLLLLLQTLKIVRYTSRLIAAVSPPGSDTQKSFEALQSSVGTSRCVWSEPQMR